MEETEMSTRNLHPAYNVIDEVQKSWTENVDTLTARTRLIVKALAESGLLKDAEIAADFIYKKDN
jgi:hypothetical protein